MFQNIIKAVILLLVRLHNMEDIVRLNEIEQYILLALLNKGVRGGNKKKAEVTKRYN